jgi:hypothetical protein
VAGACLESEGISSDAIAAAISLTNFTPAFHPINMNTVEWAIGGPLHRCCHERKISQMRSVSHSMPSDVPTMPSLVFILRFNSSRARRRAMTVRLYSHAWQRRHVRFVTRSDRIKPRKISARLADQYSSTELHAPYASVQTCGTESIKSHEVDRQVPACCHYDGQYFCAAVVVSALIGNVPA